MWGKGMGRTQKFILLHDFAIRRIGTPYKYIFWAIFSHIFWVFLLPAPLYSI